MSQSSSWRGSRPRWVSENAVGMEVEEDDFRALRRRCMNQPAGVGERENGGTNTGGGMSQSSSWRGSRPRCVSESAVGMEVEEDDFRALRRQGMNQPAGVGEREDGGANTGGGMSQSSSWRGSRPPWVSESAVGMEVEEDDSRALRRRSTNQPAEVDEREDSGTNTGGGMSRKQLIERLTSAVCERERSGHGGGGG